MFLLSQPDATLQLVLAIIASVNSSKLKLGADTSGRPNFHMAPWGPHLYTWLPRNLCSSLVELQASTSTTTTLLVLGALPFSSARRRNLHFFPAASPVNSDRRIGQLISRNFFPTCTRGISGSFCDFHRQRRNTKNKQTNSSKSSSPEDFIGTPSTNFNFISDLINFQCRHTKK